MNNKFTQRIYVDFQIKKFLDYIYKTKKISYSHFISGLLIKEMKSYNIDVRDLEKANKEIQSYYECKEAWCNLGFMENMINRIHDFIKRHQARNQDIPYKSLQILIKKELQHAYLKLPQEIIEEHYSIIQSLSIASNDIIKMKNYCKYVSLREPNQFMKSNQQYHNDSLSE